MADVISSIRSESNMMRGMDAGKWRGDVGVCVCVCVCEREGEREGPLCCEWVCS